MTIIGEKAERIYIIGRGAVLPAQFADVFGDLDSPEREDSQDRYTRADQLNDVSYESKRKVLALCRICADVPTPYSGRGRADLLLIASGGIDWENRLDEILEAHERKLKPDALIVQCDHSKGNKFIYSLRHKNKVGKKVMDKQRHGYIVYNI